MAACLRSRFLAISRSSAPSNASTSLNADAIATCSGTEGTTIGYRRTNVDVQIADSATKINLILRALLVGIAVQQLH